MRYNFVAAAALSVAAFAPAVHAQSSVVPAQPTSFELVNLRMTVDSCAFDPATVRVAATGTTLRVTQRLNACLLPGTPRTVDVRLGELPAGDYRVEVYASPDTDGPPAETLAFAVRDAAEIAVVPPPVRPLTDYTGLWWNPEESGWGLTLHQGATHAVFGAWFVYGAGGEPEWFTLQGGQWLDSTTWRGTVYRTTGPFFAGPDFDPRLVLIRAAGTATLSFAGAASAAGMASFTYTVDGVTATRPITRMRF